MCNILQNTMLRQFPHFLISSDPRGSL